MNSTLLHCLFEFRKFNFSFYLKKVWTKSFRYKFHEKLNVV